MSINDDHGQEMMSPELSGQVEPSNNPSVPDVDSSPKLLVKYSGEDEVTLSCTVGSWDGRRLDVDNIPIRQAFKLLKRNVSAEGSRVESIMLKAYDTSFLIVNSVESCADITVYGIYGETCSVTLIMPNAYT